MFTETAIIAISIVCIGLGVVLKITVYFVKQKMIEEVEKSNDPPANIEKRISPFIDIHQSVVKDLDSSTTSESANRLKTKIESFKDRNKFYQS